MSPQMPYMTVTICMGF